MIIAATVVQEMSDAVVWHELAERGETKMVNTNFCAEAMTAQPEHRKYFWEGVYSNCVRGEFLLPWQDGPLVGPEPDPLSSLTDREEAHLTCR